MENNEKGLTFGRITKRVFSEKDNRIVAKVYFKKGYRLIMSFRYSVKTQFYRSSLNLERKSRHKWNSLVRVDDAHDFKHADIDGHKHLIVSATMQTPITEGKEGLVVRLPENWYSLPTVSFIYSGSGKGPLIICPPFEKLAEQLLELCSLTRTKSKIVELNLPMAMFKKPVRFPYPTYEPEVIEKFVELGDELFKKLERKYVSK